MKTLLLLLLSSAPALAGDDLMILSSSDLHSLSVKAGKALAKCPEARRRPEVVVEVVNKTDEFIDKTQLATLLHSEIEKKTHVTPSADAPQYEVRAVLASEKQVIHLVTRATYSLDLEVLQAGESFCKKTVKLVKRSNKEGKK